MGVPAGEGGPVDHEVQARGDGLGAGGPFDDADQRVGRERDPRLDGARGVFGGAAEPVGLGVDPVHQPDADLGGERVLDPRIMPSSSRQCEKHRAFRCLA